MLPIISGTLPAKTDEVQRWLPQLLPYRQTLAVDLRLAILIHFLTTALGTQEFPSLAPYIAEMTELMEICPYVQLHASFWYHFRFVLPTEAPKVLLPSRRRLRWHRRQEMGRRLGAEFCIYIDHDFKFARIQWGHGSFLIDEGEIERATSLDHR